MTAPLNSAYKEKVINTRAPSAPGALWCRIAPHWIPHDWVGFFCWQWAIQIVQIYSIRCTRLIMAGAKPRSLIFNETNEFLFLFEFWMV